MFLTNEGGGRQQSFTQAAPNELKLGEEGQSDAGWLSAWRWRRGVREGRTNGEAGIRAESSSLTSKRPKSVDENIKDI